jgi:hypothetical protein
MSRIANAKAGAALAIASQALEAAGGWPNMSSEVGREFTRIGAGLPVSDFNKFVQTDLLLFHVVANATAGQTQLTFFNVPAQDHVCNFNNGTPNPEQPLWIRGVSVWTQDLTAGGAADGNSMDVAATTSITRAEQWKKILCAATLRASVNNRRFLDHQDLTHFPQGGGFHLASAQVSYAAATAGSIAPWTNGVPLATNIYRFSGPGIAVLPGMQVSAQMLWQTPLPITTNGGRIVLGLWATSVSPRNI